MKTTKSSTKQSKKEVVVEVKEKPTKVSSPPKIKPQPDPPKTVVKTKPPVPEPVVQIPKTKSPVKIVSEPVAQMPKSVRKTTKKRETVIVYTPSIPEPVPEPEPESEPEIEEPEIEDQESEPEIEEPETEEQESEPEIEEPEDQESEPEIEQEFPIGSVGSEPISNISSANSNSSHSSNSMGTVPVEHYLQLYSDLVKTKEENLKLKSKVMVLKEDLRKWREKKTSKQTKLKGEELKNAFIDMMLNSSLNIEAIPDDVEREIYSFIIDQLSFAATTVSGFKKFFICP
jgi:hypothetical protein